MFWRRRKQREQDLERELRSHLDAEAEEQRESGVPKEEAHYAAKRALGNVTRVKEETRTVWGWTWIGHLIQDVRYAGRQLRRSLVFAAATVLTLALGIGANTAIFSVADAVLFRPLPYPHADRLVMIWNELSKIGVRQMSLSTADIDAFRANHRIFKTAAAFNVREQNLVGLGNAERVFTISTTPGLLEMLGAHTSFGRLLTAADWKADRNQVAVISNSVLVRGFGGNPAIVGRTIRLDDRIYTVAGVLAPGFEFGLGSGNFDVWIPLPPIKDRRSNPFRMLALMRPGVGIQAAQAAVAATANHLKETIHPYEGPNGEDGGYGARVVSLHEQLLHGFRAGTLMLMVAVALVLLIACVNVANLLLSRAMAREKEIAIRRAVGASRFRLIRQWLTEAGLLAMLGGAVGFIGSIWGVELLKLVSPIDLPAVTRIEVNGRALLFTFSVSAIVCVLFSMAPLFSALHMTSSLRGPRRRQHMSNVLVATEVAFALMLLVGSALLLKSFAHLKEIDPGIRPDHLLTMLVDLSGSNYEKPRDRIHFFSELRDRLARLPGVLSASTTDRLPVFTAGVDTRSGNPFSIDGSPWNPNAPIRQIAHTGTVGLGYFHTMGIPLIAGRTFLKSDKLDTQPVAVINQTLTRKFFPRQNPIGKRILLGAPSPGARWLTIVGVIGDVRTGAIDLPPMPQFYAPEMQYGSARMFLVLRTRAAPQTVARSAGTVVRQLDPELPVDHIGTMEEHVNKTIAQPRFRTLLLTVFGIFALFLASVGIYGVATHAVIQRTQEIGIRMALGANAASVTASVLADGLRPVAAGTAMGLVGAAILVRFLSSVLYQVSPSDPLALSGAAITVGIVAALACLGPARRASHIDPLVALRHE